MKERIIRTVVEKAFIFRYWVIITLLLALTFITYYIHSLPYTDLKDTIAVFTSGAVVITIFYHILNYEYTQRKFQHDIKSSKDLLSFNIAMEWQKEYMEKNITILFTFYETHKELLEDGKIRKFQKMLDKKGNESCYTSLLVVLNFSESVCLAVKQQIMDEEFIKGFFKTVFISQYNRLSSYIEFRRKERQNPNIWINFTDLSKKWITLNT